MEEIQTSLQHLWELTWFRTFVLPGVVFFLVFLSISGIRRFIGYRLGKSPRAKELFSNGFTRAFKGPARLLTFLLAFLASLQASPSLVRSHPVFNYGIKIGFIVFFLWATDRTIKNLLKSKIVPPSLSGSTGVLIHTIVRVVLISLGLLIILDTVGISITPLLASLGVSSIAVALALQDTLGNFFSGLYLLADKPVRIGDCVRLEDGTEGHVVKIGWRSTQIELLNDSMVVLPNSKIANTKLTNFNLPNPETGFTLNVGVAYESDLKQVEKIAMEIAEGVLKKFYPGKTHLHQPSARFSLFGESAVDLVIGFRVAQYADLAELKHELILEIHDRFRREKISIPYPHRVVQTLA